MNINPLIETALSQIGCPVDPIKHDGSEDCYITYYTTSEADELYADDDSIVSGAYATVDIYSKGNFKTLVTDVRNKLRQAGFIIQPSGLETFESETQYYHVVIEIYIEEGTEG